MTKVKEKYLTDMKELPPEVVEENKENPEGSVKKITIQRATTQSTHPQNNKDKVTQNNSDKKSYENEYDADETSHRKIPLGFKEIFLWLANLISLIFLVLILVNLPKKAAILQDLRTQKNQAEVSVPLDATSLGESEDKASKLNSLFLDESGVVNFVNSVEGIKQENIPSPKINFASIKAVKDKTGNLGIPTKISFQGDWVSIDSTLTKIDQLPFLFRPVLVEIQRSKDDPNVILFSYGIFLYVNDKFGEIR